MNALYSAGTRQISSIQADLQLMAEGKATPAVQGEWLLGECDERRFRGRLCNRGTRETGRKVEVVVSAGREALHLLANAEAELTTAFQFLPSLDVPTQLRAITAPLPPGQITTTLNAFSRVIDDYDQMAKKETKLDKREKALL
jgi:hypothetical protein